VKTVGLAASDAASPFFSANPKVDYLQENLMKWIVAIIQPYRIEAVQKALTETEVFRLTVSDVQGYGRQKGHTEYFRGQPMQVNLIRKVRIDVAVNDNFVQRTIDAIIKGARSGEGGKGQVGDGKIFVVPLENTIRVSDGVQGGEAI
jgi:nitrogen regulatory protein P-II 1